MSLAEAKTIPSKTTWKGEEVDQIYCGIPVKLWKEIAAGLAVAEQLIVDLKKRIEVLEQLKSA